jgi:hypothetical protein
MGLDFIDELLDALNRVMDLDRKLLKEILIINGMPKKSDNLRYLGFNRQIDVKGNQVLEFSAMAVINNRRADQWRLEGFRKKISKIIFFAWWTRNPLDLFLNTLRCHSQMMDILKRSQCNYTVMGGLKVSPAKSPGPPPYVQPVIAVPGISEDDTRIISSFEIANQTTRFSWLK